MQCLMAIATLIFSIETAQAEDTMKLKVTINNSKVVSATLEMNQAAKDFAALLPLTLDMDDLHGNEKKYDLPNTLSSEDSNPGRIGVLGICGSGSFAISAAKIDPRMKAIATVSMYDMGSANRNALNHSLTLEQRKKIIADAAEQRYAEFTGGETKYTGGTDLELTDDTHPIQREFYDFYRTSRGEFTPKGASPDTTTKPTLTSNVKFMNFYPFNDIETISPRPMLFIAGEKAHSIEFSQDAYKLAGEPKELVIIPNAGHVDLYDRVNLIPFDKLSAFFKSNLK